jgi:hypothetical protein
MKTISTQVFDDFTAHNLSGFARKLTVKKYLAPQDSTSNSRRLLTRRGTEFRLTAALHLVGSDEFHYAEGLCFDEHV